MTVENMPEQISQSNSLDKLSITNDTIFREVLKRRLLWHGIFLCTLGFSAGLFIPLYANPRAGLATHLLGITEGLFIVAIGFCYPELKLSPRFGKINFWILLIGAYFGIFAEFLGAVFGLTRVFVITAMGLPETIPWLEMSVEIVIKGISILILLSCFIVLFGLRGTRE